jgi:hypothetical protein
MIGDGNLSQNGTGSGKAVGEVAKKGSGWNNDSEPALLWKQGEKCFVIYHEH